MSQNVNFEVDTGVNVGGVVITASTSTITTTGNIVINNPYRNTTSNSIPTTGYVQNMAVVFGI